MSRIDGKSRSFIRLTSAWPAAPRNTPVIRRVALGQQIPCRTGQSPGSASWMRHPLFVVFRVSVLGLSDDQAHL